MKKGTKMAPVKTKFAEATAVKQQSSHEYLADFPDDWCIGTGEYLHQDDLPAWKLIGSSAAWRVCNSMLPPSSNGTLQDHPFLSASTSYDHFAS